MPTQGSLDLAVHGPPQLLNNDRLRPINEYRFPALVILAAVVCFCTLQLPVQCSCRLQSASDVCVSGVNSCVKPVGLLSDLAR